MPLRMLGYVLRSIVSYLKLKATTVFELHVNSANTLNAKLQTLEPRWYVQGLNALSFCNFVFPNDLMHREFPFLFYFELSVMISRAQNFQFKELVTS